MLSPPVVSWEGKTMKLQNIFLLAALTLAPFTVRAESLEEEERWQREGSYMDRSVESTETQCGVKITYEWDKKSLLEAKAEEQRTAQSASINGRSSALYDEIESICRASQSGKDRVAKSIKKIIFRWGGKGKMSLALKGGTLTYTLDYEASNVSDAMKAFLKKNL